MVQREIADRLRASPGSRTYGAPSVLVQLACEVELAADGGPRPCFGPGRGWTRRSCGSGGEPRQRRRRLPGSCATRSRIAASRSRDRSSWPGGRRGRRCAGRSGALGLDPRTLGPRRSRPPTSSSSRSAWRSVDAPRAGEAQPLPLPRAPAVTDGLHEIRSLFCPLTLADRIVVIGRRTRTRWSAPGVEGPNLAGEALAALRARGWRRSPREGGDREAHSRGGRAGRRQRRRRGAPAPGA